jgi:outer membrane protein
MTGKKKLELASPLGLRVAPIVGVLVLQLLLPGTPPATELAAQERLETGEAAAPQEPPLLTIDEALRLARERNPTLLQARNQATIARNDRTLGNAGFLPAVNIGAQQNRRTLGSGLGGAGLFEEGTLDVAATVGYTVFDGFRRHSIYQLLGAEEEEFRIVANQVVENVLADVAVVYYDLTRQQQQIQTLREAIEISEDRLRIAELQWDIGSESELEVRRAQVDRNEDRAALLRQEVALADGMATLSQLLDHAVATEFRVADSIPVRRDLDLDELSAMALRANRNVRIAEQRVLGAELEREAIRRERWPTVGLQVGYALNNLADPLGLTPSRPSGFTYGVSMSLNLFDGFNRSRRIENARIRTESSVLAVRDARTRVTTGMEAAYSSFRNRIILVELEEENAELAARNVEVALERFRLGLSTSLELREVQNALTNARSRLAAARFDAKRAEIELLTLAGQYPGS